MEKFFIYDEKIQKLQVLYRRQQRQHLERKIQIREAHSYQTVVLREKALERELDLISQNNIKAAARNQEYLNEIQTCSNTLNDNIGDEYLNWSKNKLLQAKLEFGKIIKQHYPQWNQALDDPIEFEKQTFEQNIQKLQQRQSQVQAFYKQKAQSYNQISSLMNSQSKEPQFNFKAPILNRLDSSNILDQLQQSEETEQPSPPKIIQEEVKKENKLVIESARPIQTPQGNLQDLANLKLQTKQETSESDENYDLQKMGRQMTFGDDQKQAANQPQKSNPKFTMIEDVDDFSMGTTPPNGSEKGPVVAKSNNPGIEIQTIRPNTENLQNIQLVINREAKRNQDNKSQIPAIKTQEILIQKPQVKTNQVNEKNNEYNKQSAPSTRSSPTKQVIIQPKQNNALILNTAMIPGVKQPQVPQEEYEDEDVMDYDLEMGYSTVTQESKKTSESNQYNNIPVIKPPSSAVLINKQGTNSPVKQNITTPPQSVQVSQPNVQIVQQKPAVIQPPQQEINKVENGSGQIAAKPINQQPIEVHKVQQGGLTIVQPGKNQVINQAQQGNVPIIQSGKSIEVNKVQQGGITVIQSGKPSTIEQPYKQIEINKPAVQQEKHQIIQQPNQQLVINRSPEKFQQGNELIIQQGAKTTSLEQNKQDNTVKNNQQEIRQPQIAVSTIQSKPSIPKPDQNPQKLQVQSNKPPVASPKADDDILVSSGENFESDYFNLVVNRQTSNKTSEKSFKSTQPGLQLNLNQQVLNQSIKTDRSSLHSPTSSISNSSRLFDPPEMLYKRGHLININDYTRSQMIKDFSRRAKDLFNQGRQVDLSQMQDIKQDRIESLVRSYQETQNIATNNLTELLAVMLNLCSQQSIPFANVQQVRGKKAISEIQLIQGLSPINQQIYNEFKKFLSLSVLNGQIDKKGAIDMLTDAMLNFKVTKNAWKRFNNAIFSFINQEINSQQSRSESRTSMVGRDIQKIDDFEEVEDLEF